MSTPLTSANVTKPNPLYNPEYTIFFKKQLFSYLERRVVGSFITITSAISPNFEKYSFNPSEKGNFLEDPKLGISKKSRLKYYDWKWNREYCIELKVFTKPAFAHVKPCLKRQVKYEIYREKLGLLHFC